MTQSLIAQVILDSPGLFLDKPFDYRIVNLNRSVGVGERVLVPFRNAVKAGVIWCVREVDVVPENVKSIVAFVDDAPVLTQEQLDLAAWLCTRYACSIQDALGAILPGAFRVRGNIRLEGSDDGEAPDDVRATTVWRWIIANKPDEKTLYQTFGQSVKPQVLGWLAAGYLQRRLKVQEQVRAAVQSVLVANVSMTSLVKAAGQRDRRAVKQSELLMHLSESRELVWDRQRYGKATVDALRRSGLIELQERPVSRLAWAHVDSVDPPELTSSQQRALARVTQALSEATASTMLLHGVTGSGKTEVYIRSIQEVLSKGRSAIVLVPEIALTPQMVGRFYARFGERIAVLHSGLTKGERRDEWSRILRGDASIVIGARSAAFAPVANLGLVIVDEEHEPSYKQEEAPHYDAREVVQARAAMFGATVIYGSATPSLWALRLVETGRASIVTLPIRVNGRPLPTVEMVDMRDELREGNQSLFSKRLALEMEWTVANGQQVILFLNRRGFASAMLCRACGEHMHCPHCDISLTVHRRGSAMALNCHYCGYETAYPAVCPVCQEPAMRAFGIGTEQIEETLKKDWPQFRVLRMDVDTTRKKGTLKEMIDAFEAHEADILIGTQMIAKGLDFPHVRLVGVIAADTMLAVPDYRANERTFQLLTQVTGRAGRADTDGLTIIQTYRPEHFAIQTAAHHDFQTFYQEERTQRDVFVYPPFCELTVFLASHTDERLARGAAMRFERELRRQCNPDMLTLLPASPSGVRRIEDKFRYQVVLKYQEWESVREIVDASYRIVKARMNHYGGTCRLDVNAQRIG